MSRSLPNAEASEFGPSASIDSIFDEGRWLTDRGVSISTFFVNLQSSPEFQWPNEMPVIAKGSSHRFAITNCGTVHLSKPAKFRDQGETLISDPNEGITNRTISRVDGAPDLERAAEVDDEMARGASSLGLAQQRTTSSTRSSAQTTITYGKNCWIWCAAIAPQTRSEQTSWMESLGYDYDCVNKIASPRKFARALASAFVEQFGARGSPTRWRHPSGNHTEHAAQYVFHGPVVYVDDPHAYVSQGAGDFERTLRAAFFKHSEYEAQREYRIVIWSDDEPDELTLDVEATAELLAEVRTGADNGLSGQEIAGQHPLNSTQEAAGDPRPATSPDDATSDQASSELPDGAVEQFAASQPIHAHSTTEESTSTTRDVQLQHHQTVPAGKIVQVSENMRSVTVETSRYPFEEGHDATSELFPPRSALNARAHALHYLFRSLAVEVDYSIDRSAALLHAEKAASRLLLEFVDPVEMIQWKGGVIVIRIKAPAELDAAAEIAIGPHGTAQYKIETPAESEHVSCEDVFVAAEVFIEDLHRLGLPTCQEAIGNMALPMLPPITLPSDEQPNSRIKRQAQIQRRTVEESPSAGEADADAANAQIEPRPDDAQIAGLVIDYGADRASKVHAIRSGLSGTYRQRTQHDQLTIRVETMNPDATVEIEPPDRAPTQEGHMVALPDGEDTVITFTATSPDGTAQSEVKFIAERSDEG